MIVLLFTGGTISMRHDPALGGAVPTLRGRDILALAPGIEKLAPLEIDDWGAYPGPHMTVERMWALRQRIVDHLDRPEVDGIVVTHGTDALEESVYVVARSIASDKPVVFTGAMRTSSDLGWDGPANLGAAVRVATSADARGLRRTRRDVRPHIRRLDVTKTHTHKLESFDSPGLGPLGVVDDGQVIFRRALPAPASILTPTALAEPVDIIFTYAGADSRLLDASRERGPRRRHRGDGPRQRSAGDGRRNRSLDRRRQAGRHHVARVARTRRATRTGIRAAAESSRSTARSSPARVAHNRRESI